MGKREIDVGFCTLTYFSPKFHDEMFLKTDIICVNQFGTGCLKKKSLTTGLVFVLLEVLICMDGSKRRDIRASILVLLASQSNVARNAA